ncbi:MAG: hypothetical protein M1333_01045 [Patescibacteria group bacterium]|nr:hypothetical protein [Patescibacteria group bacterium]
MEELESQIAKITLGNFKQTKSFVYVMAEKAPANDTELYVVAELPFFNPAAAESCERICLAIGSSLKRAYRQHASEGTFENALSYINEELSKLASTGQTHWINKLNCVIAAKDKNLLTVASCGKVVAYMLRDQELTDISCSTEKPSPVKTFESYASGKIRLGDLVIFSTTQLFNYLSVDRVKNILGSMDFLPATQSIIDHLKVNAGPEVAFGILMNLQVEPGRTPSEEVDLENYLVETPAQAPRFWEAPKKFLKELFMMKSSRPTSATPVALPKRPLLERLKSWIPKVGGFFKKTGVLLVGLGGMIVQGAKVFRPSYFKSLSNAKKIFYLSIVVLLAAFLLNVFIAIKVKNNRVETARVSVELQAAQKLANDAQSALVYNDQKQAADLLMQAKAKFQSINAKSAPKDAYQKLSQQLETLNAKIERNKDVKVTLVGNLSPEDRLIRLPGYLGTQTNGQIVSFNRSTDQIQDNAIKTSENIKACVATKTAAVIYNGTSLLVWNALDGKTGPAFSTSVPDANSFAGLEYYPTNNRVYLLDKSKSSAISFLVSGDKLQKPVVSLKNISAISQAQDFSIDNSGSIYILTRDAVVKYSAGRLAEYNLPYLSKPFSGDGRIITQANVYILDLSGKRIIVTDKTGNLLYTIKNDQLSNPKDFEVDEKNKTIFVLNGSELLKLDIQ